MMVGILAWTGCRRQVYQEMYAEQNAREMRALEDRIYEYDSEYRALEQELWALEDENERLREQMSSSSDMSQKLKRKAPATPDPDPMADRPDWEMPSVLVPNKAPPSNKDGNNSSQNKDQIDKDAEIDLSPPVVSPAPIVNPNPSGAEPVPPALNVPSSKPPESNAPQFNPPGLDQRDRDRPMTKVDDRESYRAQTVSAKSGLASSEDTTKVVPASALQVASPTIEMTTREIVPSNSPNSEEDVEQHEDLSNDSERVVELRFHPTLCRGNNFDEDPADDGVYIVLQPMTDRQSLVSRPGKLTIVALDPTLDEKAGPIARWTYSETEVSELFQHKGTSQGIHLSLRWQDKEPSTDRVALYVRYVFPDGRQVVNDREIVLHQRDSLRSVWTPRVSNR